jgi:hypothetical protein
MVPSGRLSLGSAGTIEGPRDLIIGTGGSVRTDSLAGAETCSIERIPTSYFHKAHDTQIINCVGASPNARPPRALTLLLRSGLRHSSRTKSMSVGSIQSSVGCRKGVLGPSYCAPLRPRPGPLAQVGQFEVAFDTFQTIVTAYTWRIARKSGPTVLPMSC